MYLRRWKFSDMCNSDENCGKESCWKCQFPDEYKSGAYEIVSSDDESWEYRYNVCFDKFTEDYGEPSSNYSTIDKPDLNTKNKKTRSNNNYRRKKYKPLFELGGNFISKNKI